jgi:hypothetical protein
MPLPVKPAKRRYQSREGGDLWEVGTHFTLMMIAGVSPSSRTGLLPSSPLRTVHESFLSHSSSPSNASFGETRFRDRNTLVVNHVMALRMK